MRRTAARLLAAAAPWGVLVALLAMAASGVVPPTAVGANADPAEFSAERALSHVEAIAGEARPSGSPGNAAARAYLVERLGDMGLEPALQTITVLDYYSDHGEVPVVNVFASIEGTDATGAIALVAHYDTVPATPGANDNATAVAAVLEAGRALLAGPSLHNDVILLFTDGEEPAPRFGSTAFVDEFVAATGIRLVINFEAIGNTGVSELVEVVGDEAALISEYAGAVTRPAASSMIEDIVELIGGSNTDVAPFRDRGVPALEFAYLHGSPIYHTERDDIGSVHPGSLQHHGSLAVGLTRRFGDLDLSRFEGDRQEVFFTLIGRLVVHYPTGLGVAVSLVAGLLLGLSLWGETRSGRLELRRVAAGIGWLLLVALGIGVGVALVWRGLVEWLWRVRGPTGGAALVWMTALVAVCIASATSFHRRISRRVGSAEVEWAAVAAWWLPAMAAGLMLPGAGYLFVWPVLAVTVVAALRPRTWLARLGAFVVTAGITILLTAPMLDTFFQMAQPRPGNLDSQIPEVVLLVGLLTSLCTVLLIPQLRKARH